MKKILAVMLGIGLLTACAPTYKVVHMGDTNPETLSSKAKVYVSLPEDGRYKSTIYHGSGQKTAQVVQVEFSRHARSVVVGRSPESFEDALSSARERDADYLAYTTIVHWEDRATEWSGIPYRAEVKIEVVDVGSEKTLQSALLKGRSSTMSAGGRPKELLPTPIERFVEGAY